METVGFVSLLSSDVLCRCFLYGHANNTSTNREEALRDAHIRAPDDLL